MDEVVERSGFRPRGHAVPRFPSSSHTFLASGPGCCQES